MSTYDQHLETLSTGVGCNLCNRKVSKIVNSEDVKCRYQTAWRYIILALIATSATDMIGKVVNYKQMDLAGYRYFIFVYFDVVVYKH